MPIKGMAQQGATATLAEDVAAPKNGEAGQCGLATLPDDALALPSSSLAGAGKSDAPATDSPAMPRPAGSLRHAARKSDPAASTVDAPVTPLSGAVQLIPDTPPIPVKPAGTDPGPELPPALNDQPETIRAPVGRGHDAALATGSSRADASSETAGRTDVKASPPDTPSLASAPANPESKASASTFASVLASQSPGATAAATKPASVQGKGDTGTAASPAAQIAPAIISLATNASGTQRLTVRLEPEALGRVQIQIEQPVQGAAHVTVTVDRPETLNLLLRDQPQLQHALDQAGVPSEGRAVTFHVAPAEPMIGTNQHAASGGSGGGMQANAEGSQREQKSGRGSRAEDNQPLASIEPAQTFSIRQMRLGVDITA